MKNANAKQVIDKRLINLHSSAQTKHELILQMTKLLYSHHLIEDKSDFIRSVYDREKLGSTVIGFGVALPHGGPLSVLRSSIAVFKTKLPIEWEDGKFIRLAILYVLNIKDSELEFENELKEVSAKVADEALLKKLADIDTIDELYDIFTK